jgi:ribosomal-protein-alanine N-acetyltransferase
VTIVPFAPEFVDQAADLEKAAGDVRWSRFQFEKELTLAISRFFVLLQKNRLLGYGGYWKVDDEAQITNLVIGPAHRRRGLGRRLLKYLMGRARREKCRRTTLEVRRANCAAQTLYQRAGFTVVGQRPNMYENPVEDAVLMEKLL